MKKHSFGNRGSRRWSPLVLGALLPPLSFVALAFICALVLSKLQDPMGLVGAFSLAALVLSAAASSFISSKLIFERKLFPAVAFGSVFAALIFAVSLISGGGALTGRSLLNAGIYIGVSLLFASLGSREKRRKFRR